MADPHRPVPAVCIGLETSLEWPDLEQERAPLEPGMAVCIEPGVYIRGRGGLRLEDDVIVTETGAGLLSRVPRELITAGYGRGAGVANAVEDRNQRRR